MSWPDDEAWAFTSAEAADLVTREIDRFRKPLRKDASEVDAFTFPRLRAELVAQIDLLNLLDETIREALRAPSRIGPARPELRDFPDSWQSPDRRAFPVAARWRPGDAG